MDLSQLNWTALRGAIELIANGYAKRVDAEDYSVYTTGAVLRVDLKFPSVSFIEGGTLDPDAIFAGTEP